MNACSADVWTRLRDPCWPRTTAHCCTLAGFATARAARFAAPQPIAPWSDVLDTTTRGPACPQLPSRLEWVTGPVVDGLAMSEDCQVLSVTAPSDANGLPVMVWLHGGAYVSGGGEAPKYDADELARRGRVVVVRVTYRLGVLGYLSPSGVDNLGLRDQILALQWVHDNIGAFGGDPERVTVFGQSAGADSVLSLMLCEQTTGLFQRAIMQSAPLGVRDGRDAMTAAMRSAANAVTTGQLLDAQTAAVAAAAPFGLIGSLPFGPIMGSDPLPAASHADDRLGRRGAAHRVARRLHPQRRRAVRRHGSPHCAAETPRPGGCCHRAGRLGCVDAAGVRHARATTRPNVAQAMAVAPRHFG